MLEVIGLNPVVVDSEQPVSIVKVGNGLSAYALAIADSIETVQKLREIDEFRYIPMVLLAPVAPIKMSVALELGITSCITTPRQPIDLATDIPPVLKGHVAIPRSFEILLAEHNVVNQRLAVKMLEKYHHVMTVVGNGQEAVDAAKKKRYDVILMNVQMPVMVSSRRINGE